MFLFSINRVSKRLVVLASDEELFEDNPEEYTRRDIEGSDVDTRRRAACDLVNTLSQHFEQRIMEIFGQYLEVKNQTNLSSHTCLYYVCLDYVEEVCRKSQTKLAQQRCSSLFSNVTGKQRCHPEAWRNTNQSTRQHRPVLPTADFTRIRKARW